MWKNIRAFFLPTALSEMKFKTRSFKIEEQVFLISKAEVKDANTLVDVERESFKGKTPWDRYVFLKEIRRQQDAIYLVVFHAEKAVAYIGCNFLKQEAHITNIAVLPDFQGIGIASYMLRVIQPMAIEKGCTIISLEVRKDNTQAIHFYRHFGFQTRCLKPRYYKEDKQDALDMFLTIPKREDTL